MTAEINGDHKIMVAGDSNLVMKEGAGVSFNARCGGRDGREFREPKEERSDEVGRIEGNEGGNHEWS